MDRARRVMKLIFASLKPISYVELTICNGYIESGRVAYLECSDNPRLDDGEERLRKKAKFYPTSRRVSVPMTTSHIYVSITAPATCRQESRTSSSQENFLHTFIDTSVPPRDSPCRSLDPAASLSSELCDLLTRSNLVFSRRPLTVR